MRRNRADLLSLKNGALVGALVLYQIATSLYPLLSPLIGFFFCYALLLKEEEEKTMKEYFWERNAIFGYLIFTELSKGFYLFSTLIFFFLFYTLVVDWMKSAFKCRPCILVAFVASGYLGVLATNNLFAYILNEAFFMLGWEYLIYIIFDAFVAIIVFRDRL
ncbi:MAG: hypothetical protein IBX45_09180 [Campylobacterales bacterium]|nr:hypothetical protein [Campylobacterales bacterium]